MGKVESLAQVDNLLDRSSRVTVLYRRRVVKYTCVKRVGPLAIESCRILEIGRRGLGGRGVWYDSVGLDKGCLGDLTEAGHGLRTLCIVTLCLPSGTFGLDETATDRCSSATITREARLAPAAPDPLAVTVFAGECRALARLAPFGLRYQVRCRRCVRVIGLHLRAIGCDKMEIGLVAETGTFSRRTNVT